MACQALATGCFEQGCSFGISWRLEGYIAAKRKRMSSSEKKRKKRSRWGADLDEESDLAEHVGPEENIQKSLAPAAPQFTSPKRKKSRWGGDKVVGDGTADVDALPEVSTQYFIGMIRILIFIHPVQLLI